jgi:hypothetical protein
MTRSVAAFRTPSGVRDPARYAPKRGAPDYVERLHFVEHYFQENEVFGVFTERGRMHMRFGKPAYRKIADMPAQAGGSMSGSRRAWADGDAWEIRVTTSHRPEAGEFSSHHFRGREQDEPFRPSERRFKPLQRGRPQ